MNKIGGPDKIEKQKGKYMFDAKTGKKVDVTKYFTKSKSKALGKLKAPSKASHEKQMSRYADMFSR